MKCDSIAAPAASTVGLWLPLAILDLQMHASGGTGIIPFELAGPDRSPEILRAWGVRGRRAARMSLLLDFPFLVAYTTLNVRLTNRSGNLLSASDHRTHGRLAPAVAAVQIGAGVCDALENAALLIVLARRGDARMAGLARTAARVKFAGLAAGWLYSIGAWSSRRALHKDRIGARDIVR